METESIGKIIIRVFIRLISVAICCAWFFLPTAIIKVKHLKGSAIAILFTNVIIPFACASGMGLGGPYDYLSKLLESKLIACQ